MTALFVPEQRNSSCCFGRGCQQQQCFFGKWVKAVLPATKYTQFEEDVTRLRDAENLQLDLIKDDYQMLLTLSNLIEKFMISEASVERAFSKHKMLHSQLRANLSAERIDDQLFLR